jgi:hypothetical protein
MLCLDRELGLSEGMNYQRVGRIAFVMAWAACWFNSQVSAVTIYPNELPNYSTNDATAALQAAINSNPDTIVLRSNTPWLISSQILIFNRNNIDIIFEPGTTVEAKEGSFQGSTLNLFRIEQSDNISMTSSGAGATIKMRKSDYLNPSLYTPSEHRHAVSIRGSQNVTLSNMTIRDTGGDGIYITGGFTDAYSDSVTIQDVNVDNSLRNAMSVISVDGLLVERSTFNNSSGPGLGAGIDFEPNGDYQRLKNILIRDVELKNNYYRAFTFATQTTANAQPISIRVENAAMSGGEHGVHITGPDQGGVGSIIFDGGSIQDTRLAAVDALNSSVLNPSGRFALETSFRNMTFKNVATETNGDIKAYPVVFHNTQGKRSGGVDFLNVAIDDDRNRPFVYATPLAQVYGAADIQGDFILNNPNSAQWNLGGDLTNIHVVDSSIDPSPFTVRNVLKTGFEAPTFNVGTTTGGFGEPISGINGSSTKQGIWAATNNHSELDPLPQAVTLQGYGLPRATGSSAISGVNAGLRLKTTASEAMTAVVDLGAELSDGIVSISFDARRDNRGFFFGGYSTQELTRSDSLALFGIYADHTDQWVYLNETGLEQDISNGVIADQLAWGRYTISLDLNNGTYNVLIDNGTDSLSLSNAAMNFDVGVDTLRYLQFSLSAGQQADILFDNFDVYHTTSIMPGDFDGDGDVDGRDFLKYQRGESPDPLSPEDLADWNANYGVPGLLASSEAVIVPETSSLLLFAIAAIASAVSRHQQRQW